jgi:hypothetical protein
MKIKFISKLTIFGLILGTTALLAQAKPTSTVVAPEPAKPVEKTLV